MREDPAELIRSIDAPVEKAVKDLALYAKSHPQALAVRAALDGILGSLIQAARQLNTAEGDETLSVSLLEELTTLFPDNPDPFLHLSKICIDRGDHQAALRYAEAGLLLDPDNPDLVFNKALSLLETGKHESAISLFKRHIELNPNNPWAYNNIGEAYRKLHLYDSAETALKQAIECDHRFLPAYHNLALLYIDRRDWPSCIYYAEIAERQGPADKEVELALGDAFMGLGEQRRALQHLVAATLIDSGFVEAYESMSAAYVDLAMYDLSVAAANQALKLNPESWMALANIGYSYSMQGRFQEAINMQLKALEKNPTADGTYKLYWGLGWAYLQVDQYSQALDYTERAIHMREQPDLALSFNRALILLAEKKIDEANNACDQAIARAVNLEDYQAILEGAKDAQDFITKRGTSVAAGSAFFELLKVDVSLPSLGPLISRDLGLVG